jgi:hypothetical protein
MIQARAGAHITVAEMEIYPLLLALLKDITRFADPNDPNPNLDDTAWGNTITFDRVSVIGRPGYGALTGSLTVAAHDLSESVLCPPAPAPSPPLPRLDDQVRADTSVHHQRHDRTWRDRSHRLKRIKW